MTLPISQAASILAAARTASDVAGNVANRLAGAVGDVVGFDEVLRDTAEPDAAEAAVPETTDSLISRTIAAIRDRLARVGLGANPSVDVTVQSDGKMQVRGDHDQAARIEMILAGDDELIELASRLHAAAGNTTLTIGAESNDSDLTKGDTRDTMIGSPGGYANW